MELTETSTVVSDDRTPWQRAYLHLMACDIRVGSRITTDELYAAMGIPKFPDRHESESDRAFAQRVQLWSVQKFAPQMETLKAEVLARRGLWMRSRGRRGDWEFLAAESADILVKQTVKDVRATLRTATTTLDGMSVTECSDAERAAHANAIAKVAHLQTLMRAGTKQ